MNSATSDQAQPRVQRRTLAQQAAELIVLHIDKEHLVPGALLPSEAQLAGQFGVSRPVLREAMRLLEANGVVTVVNGRGAMVKPLGAEMLAAFFQRAARDRRDAIREVLEVRKGIEVECAALAAERRTLEQLEELNTLISRMRDSIDEMSVFNQSDLKLHLLIAQASGNRLFVLLVESLRGVIEESFTRRPSARATRTRVVTTQASHERIIAAIDAGDSAAAGAAMAEHIDDGIRFLFE